MRLNLSAWQTGALLSVIALVSHGSGAVNLDGLNPLLAAGCAHQPGSRLTVRHHRSLGIFDRSITLKPSHKVRLAAKRTLWSRFGPDLPPPPYKVRFRFGPPSPPGLDQGGSQTGLFTFK